MTEQTIPANAEGLPKKSIISPELLERAKAADKSASIAYAMIAVCKAASEYLDDQPSYEGAKSIPANIAECLGHVNELVLDVCIVVERVIMEGRAK